MPTSDVDEITREIQELEHRLAAAWKSGDCAGWGALIAEEWSVTHINGAVITREQALAMCRSPQVQIADMRYDDLAVKVFGNTAVATGQTTATTAGSSPETVVLRFTDVWLRRDGRWQVVASQATRVDRTFRVELVTELTAGLLSPPSDPVASLKPTV